MQIVLDLIYSHTRGRANQQGDKEENVITHDVVTLTQTTTRRV